MATLNETNTLNDARYLDSDVNNARKNETPSAPPVGNEYDVVYSFFANVMKDPQAAGNFTTSLYRVAEITQTDVLVLLENLKGKKEIEINAIMAYYLNGLRAPSTLLGVQNTVRPNYYAGRNVLS